MPSGQNGTLRSCTPPCAHCRSSTDAIRICDPSEMALSTERRTQWRVLSESRNRLCFIGKLSKSQHCQFVGRFRPCSSAPALGRSPCPGPPRPRRKTDTQAWHREHSASLSSCAPRFPQSAWSSFRTASCLPKSPDPITRPFAPFSVRVDRDAWRAVRRDVQARDEARTVCPLTNSMD
jgi:hypothetical protein